MGDRVEGRGRPPADPLARRWACWSVLTGIVARIPVKTLKRDEFPVRPIRLDRRVLIPVADLLRYLGISSPNGD